jgi:hypothetical protein
VLPLPRLLPSGAHDQTKNNTGSGVSWQVFLSTCEDCRRLRLKEINKDSGES